MSTNLLQQPVQSRASLAIGGLLIAGVVTMSVLWWYGKGPFQKKASRPAALLKNERKLVWVYSSTDTRIEAGSLMEQEDTFNPERMIIALDAASKSYPYTRLLAGREPEMPLDEKQWAKTDAEIRQAIPDSIKRVGLQPEEYVPSARTTDIWGKPRTEPFRLVVTVKKRFEKTKCLFWTQVQLEQDHIVLGKAGRHVYAKMLASPENDFLEFSEVPRDAAKQAIVREISEKLEAVLIEAAGTSSPKNINLQQRKR